jgi:hypothetical protein
MIYHTKIEAQTITHHPTNSRRRLIFLASLLSVAVFTDGEENSSHTFTQGEVKRLVMRLKTQGWSFNYYGTDVSVEEMKERLAFDGGMVMEKSDSGFRSGMANYSMSSSNQKSSFLKDWMKEDFSD